MNKKINAILANEEEILSCIVNNVETLEPFDLWSNIKKHSVRKVFLYATFPEVFHYEINDNEKLKSKRIRIQLNLPTSISILFKYSELTVSLSKEEKRCGELVRANLSSRLRINNVKKDFVW